MNGKNDRQQEAYRAFLLLSELEKEESVTQRELAERLGIALGLVNSYLKNLVAKGFLRVKTFPRNRYAYLLTPKGLAEKSRLAYQHLSYFTGLYTTTRQEFFDLFNRIYEEGDREVIFCGVDEVAEIAFLSLQEARLKLAAVLDEKGERTELFGVPVLPLEHCPLTPDRKIVVTSIKRRDLLTQKLRKLHIDFEEIRSMKQGV